MRNNSNEQGWKLWYFGFISCEVWACWVRDQLLTFPSPITIKALIWSDALTDKGFLKETHKPFNTNLCFTWKKKVRKQELLLNFHTRVSFLSLDWPRNSSFLNSIPTPKKVTKFLLPQGRRTCTLWTIIISWPNLFNCSIRFILFGSLRRP